jgi:hypothetical protein
MGAVAGSIIAAIISVHNPSNASGPSLIVPGIPARSARKRSTPQATADAANSTDA